MKQHRMDSFMEAVTNTAVGFVISLITWYFVADAMDIPVTWSQNLIITGIFTAVSIIRGYVLRRIFDGRTIWQEMKYVWQRKAV